MNKFIILVLYLGLLCQGTVEASPPSSYRGLYGQISVSTDEENEGIATFGIGYDFGRIRAEGIVIPLPNNDSSFLTFCLDAKAIIDIFPTDYFRVSAGFGPVFGLESNDFHFGSIGQASAMYYFSDNLGLGSQIKIVHYDGRNYIGFGIVTENLF